MGRAFGAVQAALSEDEGRLIVLVVDEVESLAGRRDGGAGSEGRGGGFVGGEGEPRDALRVSLDHPFPTLFSFTLLLYIP